MSNICRTYFLPCPYALSGEDGMLPCCVPNQEGCDKYVEKYKLEASEDYNKLQNIKKDLGEFVLSMSQETLWTKIIGEFNK